MTLNNHLGSERSSNHPARHWHHHQRTLGLLLCIGFLFTLTLAAPSWSNQAQAKQEPRSADGKTHRRHMSYMKRVWGVDIVHVRPASAGYMLEFRYKVLDPVKAAPLFDRQSKPVLIDASSGARLIVPTPPTTGALRNSNPPLADHTYWMFFANPGKFVQSGQQVDIVIGDFRAENITVK